MEEESEDADADDDDAESTHEQCSTSTSEMDSETRYMLASNPPSRDNSTASTDQSSRFVPTFMVIYKMNFL